MHVLRPLSLLAAALSFLAALPSLAGPSAPAPRALPPPDPTVHIAGGTCTLVGGGPGGGGDAGPALVRTARDARCGTVVVPAGEVLTVRTRMDMTGLRDTHIDVRGTIRFSPDVAYWTENAFPITFQTQITFWLLGGTNVRLDGGGTLDGAGQIWYDAFAANKTLLRPILLTVFGGEDVVVEDITMLNAPEWFNLAHSSRRITYAHIRIAATSTSAAHIANTDGWDVYRCDGVVIRDSTVNNGDDCVSFKPNSTNILVSNLHCNGSHGISVGSLGQFAGVFDIVENVTSTNVRITHAENGARIKAWAGPGVGAGIVRNVTFEHFAEGAVDSPVVIDQCYMTDASACAAFPSNTLIQDVVFRDISGTSSGSEGTVVASLKCSPDGRCANVTVEDLDVRAPGGAATYVCQNVNVSGNAAGLFGACAAT